MHEAPEVIVLELYRGWRFTFQPGISLSRLEAPLRELELAQAMFKQLPVLPDMAAALERDELVSSVHGTDTIEGGDLSEAEVESLVLDPALAQTQRERRIANLQAAYAIMKQHVRMTGDQTLITEGYVQTLHRTVSQNLDDERYRPGAYRNNPKGFLTWVGDAAHGGRYKPPQAHDDLVRLMRAYCDWLSSAPIQALPTPIRAALAHYYFERIHPFQDGNGRVGRLIEKTILLSGGYTLAAYRLDAYYLANLDQYFTLFNQARLAESQHDDACNHAFVAFVLAGLTATIQRLYARACTMVGDFVGLALLGQLLQSKTINPRQHAILQNLLTLSGQMTEDVFKQQAWHQALYLRLSPATKSRDWQGLRDRHLIFTDGHGRLCFGRG